MRRPGRRGRQHFRPGARGAGKQAEQILVDDVTAIAPLYYYTYVRLYKPWMTNIVISPVTGDPIHEWTIDTAAKAAARQ